MDKSDEAVLQYYEHDGTDPLPVVLDALREAGRDPHEIEIDDLAGVDEFHALGRPATMALAELVGITAARRSWTWAPAWVARRVSGRAVRSARDGGRADGAVPQGGR